VSELLGTWRPSCLVLIDNRIIAAIEAELGATGHHGVQHIPSDGRYGFGGEGLGTTDVRLNEFLVGTLIIDVTDAARQDVVWWGMGVNEVDPMANAEQRDKNINGR
jgi:hypothetical protein